MASKRRMVEPRIEEARFPAVKSLDSFDFTALPSLKKISSRVGQWRRRSLRHQHRHRLLLDPSATYPLPFILPSVGV